MNINNSVHQSTRGIYGAFIVIMALCMSCSKGQVQNIQFFTQSSPQSIVNHAEYPSVPGFLFIDDCGCLRLDQYSLIWPHGSQLIRNNKAWSIIDSNAVLIANIGDQIQVVGGECPNCEDTEFISGIIGYAPEIECKTGYWLVGNVL